MIGLESTLKNHPKKKKKALPQWKGVKDQKAYQKKG
jgi:hypothetical protein